MIVEVKSAKEMQEFGYKFGSKLAGRTVIELVGDVGAGKTTLTKGIATGLGIDEEIQSPTFTISRQYEARDGLFLAHYDFYRLDEPGIMSNELAEVLADENAVTIIEWAGAVQGVLPEDRITISITAPSEESRQLTINASGISAKLMEQIL